MINHMQQREDTVKALGLVTLGAKPKRRMTRRYDRRKKYQRGAGTLTPPMLTCRGGGL